MSDQKSTTSPQSAPSATYPIGARVSVPSQYRPGARVNVVVHNYLDGCACVYLPNGEPDVYLMSELADPVDYLTGQPAPTPAAVDWRTYQGRNVIPDGHGGFLAWRDATMATVPGYYPAKAREMPRRVGLTAAQAAEMTADLAAMAVAS